MRPSTVDTDSKVYECMECGERTGDVETRSCPECGGELLDLTKSRDL